MLLNWKKLGYTEFLNNEDLSLLEIAIKDMVEGKVSSFLLTPEINRITIDSLTIQIENQLQYSDAGVKIKAYRLYPDKKVVRLDPILYQGGMAFSGKSSNIERVLMFLNWVQSDQDNYDLLMYGIKDKHYTLKDEQIDMSIKNNKANLYIGWAGSDLFRNLEYEHVPVGYPADTNIKYLYYTKSQSIYAPLGGFFFDYLVFKQKFNDRGKKYADLIEYPIIYNAGAYNYSASIESKLEEVENVDGGSLLESIQKELDKWLAKRGK